MIKSRLPKSNSIASRVARRLDRLLEEKVIDLSAIREGRAIAERLQATAPADNVLDELHPAHATYAYVQNQISILAEALSQLDDLDRISEIVSRAEDEYVPSQPPMSPVTRSFFNTWTLFDCGVGIERETFGTILLALAARLRMSAEFADLLGKWQASRFGLFELEAEAGETARLRELVTGARIEAVNPTRYKGARGTIWYVRALPPPVAGFSQHVIVTTPYEVTVPGEQAWMAFLGRTLPKTKIADTRHAYEHLMKWGLGSNYWAEYVFEAYAGHDPDGIRLMGLPDVPESRPHSRMNEADGRHLRAWLLSDRMGTGAM
jgi:hypothetical protein